MECNSSTGQYVYENLSSASTLYLRTYVYFGSLPTSGNFLSFSEMKHADDDNDIVAAVYNDSGTMKWAIRWAPWGAPPQASASVGPNLNTWYSVELNCTLSGTTVNIELYVDGVSALNTTYASGSSDSFVYAQAGGWDMVETLTNYIDDVIVDSSYIGPATTLVTFDQTGLSSDFTGAVVTIDGFNYTFTQLPVSFLWNTGSSHNFTYQSPLIASADTKQYVWNSTNGTLGETVQTDNITAGSSGTVVGNYVTQWYVTFGQSGLDSSAAGDVVTVNGTGYPYGSPLGAGWYDSGTVLNYSYTAPVPSSNSGEQFGLNSITGPSSPITVTGKATVTGNFVTQYQVTFGQTGVGSDFAGPVVNIDGTNYGVGNLSSAVFWWDATSVHNFAFVSPLNVNSSAQYAWVSTTGLSSVESGSLTVTGSGAVTGNYLAQYKVTFDASSNVKGDSTGTIVTVGGAPETSADLPYTTDWLGSGSTLIWNFSSPVISTSSPSGTQYRWESTSGLGQTGQSGVLTITAPGTINGAYVTQYYLTIDTNPSSVNNPNGQGWYDGSTNASISTDQYANVTSSSRYNFTGWTTGNMSEIANPNSPSTTVQVDSAKTVTANYMTQYNVTFAQSGVGNDFSTSVMTVNATGYDRNGTSFWADAGDVYNFTYSSPLLVTVNFKQYIFTGANETSPFTVSAPETITGAYQTQYYLTVASPYGTTGGQGWYNNGATANATLNVGLVDHGNGTRHVFTDWSGDASGTNCAQSDPITMDGAKTAVADWKTQYYVTFNQSGVGSDFSGTVVTVNGTGHDRNGVAFWADSSDVLNFTYASPLSVNASTQYGLTGINASSPLTATTTTTITGSYVTQYLVTYSATDNATAVTVPPDEWVNSGGSAVGVFPLQVTNDGTRCNFVSDNRTAITEPSLIVGTYVNQYNLTFASFGVGSDFSGVVVTVNGTGYDRNGISFWADSGDVYNFSYASPLSVTLNIKQYVWISTGGLSGVQSGFITMSSGGSIIGHYATQYNVTFTQAGLDGSASGTVLTVNGTAKAFGDLPFSEWINDSDVLDFSFGSIVSSSTVNKQFILAGVDASSPLTVTSSQTITGSYTTQWYVTFAQTSLGVTATGTIVIVNGSALTRSSLPYSLWVNSSDSLVFNYANVSSTVSGERFIIDSVNGTSPLTVTGSATITGVYKTQYYVTFAQTGLDGTATGTVVTVNGSAEAYGGLPFSMWVNSSDSVTYNYGNVSSSITGKQFVLTSVTGLVSPITVTSPTTVTGNYKIQYQVTFNQTGASVDFTGTLVTIDSNGYNVNSLPVSFWWDNGSSHIFAFQSPLIVTANNKQYVWTGTTGLSTLQSDSINVSGSGTVTGSYKTQYYVTFAQSGVGVDFSGPVMNVSGVNYTGAGQLGWYDAGVNVTFSFYSPLSVDSGKQYVFLSANETSPLNVSAAETITGTYKTQWLVTFEQSGIPFDFLGNVMNVDGVNYTKLSNSHWYDNGTIANFSYYSPLYANSSVRYVLQSANATSPLTVTASSIVVGTYSTQYNVTFIQSGVGNDFTGTVVTINGTSYDRNGTSFWAYPFDVYTFTFSSPLVVTTNVKQYVFTGANETSPFPGSAETITGNYRTQWYVTFNQTGLDSSALGTIVTVNSTAKNYSDLPYSLWVNDSDLISYNYGAIVSSSVSGNQFRLGNVTGSTSPIIVTGPETVTGNYVIQYYVTFAQSGVGFDFSGSVMNVSNVNYTRNDYSNWFDNGTSISFGFYSPLVVTLNGEQYILTGVSGNSTASSLTVSTATTVTGTYETQWYIVITSAHGSPTEVSQWVNAASSFNVSVTNPDVVVPNGHEWNLTGLIVDGAPQTLANSVSFGSVTANHTIEFDWTEQWYISVTSAHGSPTASSGWVNAGAAFSVSVTNPDVIVPSAHQWNLTGLTVDGVALPIGGSVSIGSVTANHTIEFDWTEQWYLTVGTSPSSVNSPTGEGWYNTSSLAPISTDQHVDIVSGSSRYSFSGWTTSNMTEIADPSSSSTTVLIDEAKTVTANYVTQYNVTFRETSLDGTATGTVVTVNGSGEAYGSLPFQEWVNSSDIVTYSYATIVSSSASGAQFRLDNVTGQISPITVTSPLTVTGNYVIQYQVSYVLAPSGSGSTVPVGTNVWQDTGSLSISALANPGYMFAHWSSDTGSITFVDSTFAATTTTINGPGNITANFATANATLAVRGENDRIYYRAYNWSTSSWGDWNELPAGTTTDSPVTAICGGKQYFIVRGEDGYSLWFSWVNMTDDSFSGWTWMPGSTPSTPTLITNGTALILVVRGSDNTIYFRAYDVQAQTWNAWYGLPAGTTCDKVGAAIRGDTLQLVVRGFSTTDANINNTLWYGTMDLTSDAFSGWTFLPGSTPSTPILTAWGSNKLCLVVRGDDNTLYINTFNGTSWQGWTGLSSGSTLVSPAATVTGDTLIIVVVGMDGNTLWQSSLDLKTSSFSGWTWMPGSTPSPPILTS